MEELDETLPLVVGKFASAYFVDKAKEIKSVGFAIMEHFFCSWRPGKEWEVRDQLVRFLSSVIQIRKREDGLRWCGYLD